jgi:ligand-binding SRPBCC domain-containing protein
LSTPGNAVHAYSPLSTRIADMSKYQYSAKQFLPISIESAWDFFSSPKNLATITPPEMQFQILTKLEEGKGIYEGMLIDYIVKPLLGIPLRWQTEITLVKNNQLFTDKQLKGPYKLWEHTHTFERADGGVWMTDVVVYELPFGLIGDIAHSLFVKRKLESIFAFRKHILTTLFT